MAADVAQRERSNIKFYASTFSIIQIQICLLHLTFERLVRQEITILFDHNDQYVAQKVPRFILGFTRRLA